MRFVTAPSFVCASNLFTEACSPATAYRLVAAYLDLALSLLSAERAAYLAAVEDDESEGDWVGEEEEEGGEESRRSPLLACLTFCFELLLKAGGDGADVIMSRLMQGSPNGKTGVFWLGEWYFRHSS